MRPSGGSRGGRRRHPRLAAGRRGHGGGGPAARDGPAGARAGVLLPGAAGRLQVPAGFPVPFGAAEEQPRQGPEGRTDLGLRPAPHDRYQERTTMPTTPVNRMGTLDAEFFFAEHDNVPLHIGSVAVFAGPAPQTGYQRLFEAKLPRVPRYRQVVRAAPFQLLRPVWADDQEFRSGTTSGIPRSRSRRPGATARGRGETVRPAAGPAPAAVGGVASHRAGRRPLGASCPRFTTAWSTASAATT